MPDKTIKQLTDDIIALAQEKGFGVTPDEVNTLEKFALIHSEISEAMEAFRHKRITGQDGMAEELADAIIRILHLAGVHNIDLEKEIIKKLKANKDREWDWDKIHESHK